MIERTLPRAGQLSTTELAGISAKSNATIRELGPELQWVQSFVTADKIYCVYHASSVDVLRDHARIAGFPVDAIHAVSAVLDPATGECT